jgi:DNA-binding transcriptional LysR family regulator
MACAAETDAVSVRSVSMDLLRHLAYFVAVAEELHFGRAAERLHMAQPPLSQRIRTLERKLGVGLFERSSRHVSLTPAGRVLVAEARRLLASAEELEETMRQVRDGTAGDVRAALPSDVGPRVIAGVVRRFRARRPDIRLDVRHAPTADQAELLSTGRLDVGLLFHPLTVTGLATGPVLEKPLGVLMPADSPLTREAEIDLGDLGDRALVLFPRETAPGPYDHVVSTCRAYGFVPSDIRHARDPQFGVGLVMAGDAVALAPAATGPDAAIAWRPLAGRPLLMEVSAAWRDDNGGRSIQAFTDAAVRALRDDGGWVARTDAVRDPSIGTAARIGVDALLAGR